MNKKEYKKRTNSNDPRPEKSGHKIIACPMLAHDREVVTLKSCGDCEYFAGISEAVHDSPEGEVNCCFPRKIPIRAVRGK